MTKLIITYKDWVHCQVNGLTNEDLHNVYNGLRVFNPNARFQPLYKMGRWDGYINFFGLTGVTYTNLLPELFSKINIKQYDIEENFPEDVLEDPDLGDPIDENYMSDLTWYEGHRLAGQPIILEEHQVRCINAMIYQHRGLLEAATGAGKTLLSAALCRKVKPFGKVVLIVDGKDLCFQTADELNKFGCDAGVVGCGLREFGHDVSVCTWQTINSISKKSKDSLNKEELKTLVDGVVAMIFDEVHRCKGNEVKKVAEQVFNNVPIRWGLTGTIPKQKIDYYNLATAIGPVLDENVQAKELQDKGFLSNCQVNCIRLKDDYKFFTWDDEKEYLASNTDRLFFMANLIAGIVQQQKNTLVLVDRIITGETLDDMLQKLGIDSIFLQGSVKSTKRFEEYKKFANEDNKCVIAIDKIASTGLNIPRLFNIVFIDYGKAFTKTIQSIGRGLRRASDKDFVTIYDISSTTKYSKDHFNNRIHYYEDAQYPYQVMNIDKWK